MIETRTRPTSVWEIKYKLQTVPKRQSADQSMAGSQRNKTTNVTSLKEIIKHGLVTAANRYIPCPYKKQTKRSFSPPEYQLSSSKVYFFAARRYSSGCALSAFVFRALMPVSMQATNCTVLFSPQKTGFANPTLVCCQESPPKAESGGKSTVRRSEIQRRV